MQVTDVVVRDAGLATTIEKVLLHGDLRVLTVPERLIYVRKVCESVGLNPLTKPFDYIELNGKLTLYANRGCTDQLRSVHAVSVKIISREIHDGVYVVTARATQADGREDESTGAVPLVKENGQWKTGHNGKRYFEGDGTFGPLAPDDRANAMMKAETKAKRRVTLSICGLSFIDESELDTVRNVRTVENDLAEPSSSERPAEAGAQPRAQTPPAPPKREPPEELRAMFDNLDKDPKHVGAAFKIMEDALIRAAGANGEEAYNKRMKALRTAYPKGSTIPADAIKACLIDLFEDSLTIQPPEFKATDADVPEIIGGKK